MHSQKEKKNADHVLKPVISPAYHLKRLFEYHPIIFVTKVTI